jgi:hypothetical protein
MKSVVGLIAAGLLATSLIPLQASGASLLGGLVKTGKDSGNSSQIVSLGSGNGTSIGLLGSEGISVNVPLGSGSSVPGLDDATGGGGGSVPIVGDLLGGGDGGGLPVVDNLLGGDGGGGLPVVGNLLGGNGVTLPVDLGDIDAGVPGVADIHTSPASGGGTSVGIELLGGGGGSIKTNPLGLLGNGGISVSLPGLGGTIDIDDDDDDGGNGGNGGNGSNGNGGGGNGGGGGGGTGGNNGGGSGGHGGGGGSGGTGGGGTIIKYLGSNNGDGGFAIPSGISDRLRALLKILADRDYLRIANGRAVCLNSFNVAEVSGWVPQKDWGALQKALSKYSQDIYTLRQLLANCRDAEQRQALNLTNLNRVIAIDINKNGQPVLFML